MSIEIYYVPKETESAVSLDRLIAALSAEELAIDVRPEGAGAAWIIFSGYQSSLLVSYNDVGCSLISLHYVASTKNEEGIPFILEDVMKDLGYTNGEDSN